MYDTRYPDNMGTATVSMRVERNAYSPVFGQISYEFEIDETTGMFTRVGQVEATDRDVLVSVLRKISILRGFLVLRDNLS